MPIDWECCALEMSQHVIEGGAVKLCNGNSEHPPYPFSLKYDIIIVM